MSPSVEPEEKGLSEAEYIQRRRNDALYISKAFPDLALSTSDNPRFLRILNRVLDSENGHEFVNVDGELCLHVTQGGRQAIKALFYEDDRSIKSITFQRFTVETNKPHRLTNFTIRGEEIEKLYNLLSSIRYIELQSQSRIRLDEHILDEWLLNREEKKSYLLNDLDLVAEIAEEHVTKSDIVALAYRRAQLNEFEQLLNDEIYFATKQSEWKCHGTEAVWQKFFEKNPWIFGYGLNFIFTSKLDDDKKLEQVTSGFSVNQSGKRVDALMKTSGLISSLCFVEIKTHRTPLLNDKPYRPECWMVSNEVCGSVAQIQKTVQKAVMDIRTKIEINRSDGSPTGNSAFLYQPKSYVVIGNLGQFINQFGVNEQQYSSFQLYRRNLNNPEIITFDELYDRAKFIVEHSVIDDNHESSLYEVEDIPF